MELVTVGDEDLKELSTSKHIYVKAKIGNETLATLINTGTSGFAFFSEKSCDRLNLKSKQLNHSITLVGFEGKSGAQITRKMSFLVTLGNHSEEMSAFITPNIKYDLVLGLPWLEKHSPYINWRENTIIWRGLSRILLL